MNNVDFISEKWRTCRRTRKLAHIHAASSIFPIMYVAVYAEAQRRVDDNKELGAALAALMFNVFQLMRTIMGIVQLNAFVAWCKDAVECMGALLNKEDEYSERVVASSSETSETSVDSREMGGERRSGGERRELNGLSRLQLELILAWCKRRMERMAAVVRNYCGNHGRNRSTVNEFTEMTVGTHVSYADVDDVEEKIEVNNTIVDNELGGREVTVLPSWKNMWNGLKKGSFEPSTWLWTDRVMLNTVRWSGAFLCGMGEQVCVDKHSSRTGVGMLEMFFSGEMHDLLEALQLVEWNIELENGSHEIMSIHGLGRGNGNVDLTGEMSTAYGTVFRRYFVESTSNVDLYSFEFNSLVSSYPANEKKIRGGNRESIRVELAHSLVLAKHLGVEKLKAIRRYHDFHSAPVGLIRFGAFILLHKQMNSSKLDDTQIWRKFEQSFLQIPLFPYRMQLVALWDEATNWRVLQASAHQDIRISLDSAGILEIENERILDNAPQEVSIFDYSAQWTMEHTV